MATSIETQPDPLRFMNRLTQSTYIFQPQTFTAKTPTIILLTWMNAAPIHIAFYVQNYKRLFPLARLILIRGTIPNMLYRPDSTQKRTLAPVLSALRAEPSSPIFLHLFSNSGAQSTSTLLRAYKESSPDHQVHLPIKAVFLDSTPSLGTYSSGYAGISYEISRFPSWIQPVGLVLVHCLLGVVWVLGRVSGRVDVLTRSNNDLNDPALVPIDAPRVYFYSEGDRLVEWKDVESHASVAKERGWDVRGEVFEGSGHCRHAKGVGEERYWRLVKMVVEEAGEKA